MLGLGGHAVGYAQHALGLASERPRIERGRNAVEFMNNPLASKGAVTLGNTTIYGDDPYDPNNHLVDVPGAATRVQLEPDLSLHLMPQTARRVMLAATLPASQGTGFR